MGERYGYQLVELDIDGPILEVGLALEGLQEGQQFLEASLGQ